MFARLKTWIQKNRFERQVRTLIDDYFENALNLSPSKRSMFGMEWSFNSNTIGDHGVNLEGNIWIGLFDYAITDDAYRFVILADSKDDSLDDVTYVFQNHVIIEGPWETEIIELLETAVQSAKADREKEATRKRERDLARLKG